MSNSAFQHVVGAKKSYNNFPLSREVLLSGQIGKLIPVQCDEVVPGDIFRQSAAFLCRFSPLSAPAMARFNVHFHSFYVPFRIITPEIGRESTYEKMIKSIGKHSSEVPSMPYFSSTNKFPEFVVGSLGDYLGYPVSPDGIYMLPSQQITAMPFLAYQRIYQDFYRRDQLEREVVYPVDIHAVTHDSGASNNGFPGSTWDDIEENQDKATYADLIKLQTRNYERDYFTSCLPEPQFGDEVAVGDGNISWLTMSEPALYDFTLTDTNIVQYSGGGQDTDLFLLNSNPSASPSQTVPYSIASSVNGPYWTLNGKTNINEFGETIANNLQGNSFTINEFRLAMQLQGIKEQINRAGTRYLEIMQGIYGVRVPDARLQRPIYLGGFKNPVSIGSVMQTSETNNTPQGTLTGQMSATGTNTLVRGGYMFTEHGYLITIMSITPRTSYYGGMPRKYMKRYPEEFYLKQFDHLGEQPVMTGELFWSNNILGQRPGTPPFDGETGEPSDANNGIFGYQLRYAEYKTALSTVHGEFRTTLDNWHVSRDFDTAPALNPDFIKAEPEDFDRIFAFTNVEGTSNEHFQMQIYLDVVAKRNMSKYSTPYTLY